jgi:hypothetical protein
MVAAGNMGVRIKASVANARVQSKEGRAARSAVCGSEAELGLEPLHRLLDRLGRDRSRRRRRRWRWWRRRRRRLDGRHERWVDRVAIRVELGRLELELDGGRRRDNRRRCGRGRGWRIGDGGVIVRISVVLDGLGRVVVLLFVGIIEPARVKQGTPESASSDGVRKTCRRSKGRTHTTPSEPAGQRTAPTGSGSGRHTVQGDERARSAPRQPLRGGAGLRGMATDAHAGRAGDVLLELEVALLEDVARPVML